MRAQGDLYEAIEILGAWQLAAFRGYSVVEKKADRRLVVSILIGELEPLIENLKAEHSPVEVLILAADETARDQWQQLLVHDGRPLERWLVQSPGELPADGWRVKSGSIVIADELEMYLTKDLAASLGSSRAILGLFGSPRGLVGARRLRKYLGNALELYKPTTPPIDFQLLLESPHEHGAPDTDSAWYETGEDLEVDDIELDLVDIVVDDSGDASDADDAGGSAKPALKESGTRAKTSKGADLPTARDAVTAYLNHFGKVALLNAEEEVELAKRIEAGLYCTELMAEIIERGEKLTTAVRRDYQWICRDGNRAKNHLLEANLRLVVSLAERYKGRGLDYPDLIQQGNLGLIRPMMKFDYTVGSRFATYARWWIRQAITRGLADQARTIRIPVHMVEVINKLGRIQRDLPQDLGREPTPEELAEKMGTTPDKVEDAISLQRGLFSLEALAEEGFDIADPADHDSLEQVCFALLRDQLQSVLETLPEREAGVVRLRHGLTDGEEHTADEIAEVYGVTYERIRQLDAQAMETLRQPWCSNILRDTARHSSLGYQAPARYAPPVPTDERLAFAVDQFTGPGQADSGP